MEELTDDAVDSLDEIDGVDPELFAFIQESLFVVLYSSSKSLEFFYLFNVMGKAIADMDQFMKVAPHKMSITISLSLSLLSIFDKIIEKLMHKGYIISSWSITSCIKISLALGKTTPQCLH